MGWKDKMTRNLRSATSDKESWNRKIMKWHKSFKEVEKLINPTKK